MSNMLKTPREKVGNKHNQEGHFHRDIKTLRKSQMKNTVTEMKNLFGSLADTTQPRIEVVNLKLGQ